MVVFGFVSLFFWGGGHFSFPVCGRTLEFFSIYNFFFM